MKNAFNSEATMRTLTITMGLDNDAFVADPPAEAARILMGIAKLFLDGGIPLSVKLRDINGNVIGHLSSTDDRTPTRETIRRQGMRRAHGRKSDPDTRERDGVNVPAEMDDVMLRAERAAKNRGHRMHAWEVTRNAGQVAAYSECKKCGDSVTVIGRDGTAYMDGVAVTEKCIG